jgi:hypothetical protein
VLIPCGDAAVGVFLPGLLATFRVPKSSLDSTGSVPHDELLTRSSGKSLDTQVFKTNNFNFDAMPLKLLKELHESERVAIYITDVVEREVRARMMREVKDSRTWYNRLRQEAMILLSAKGSPFYALEKRLDVSAVTESLEMSFDKFLADAGVEVIDCSSVPVGRSSTPTLLSRPPLKWGKNEKSFLTQFQSKLWHNALTKLTGSL